MKRFLVLVSALVMFFSTALSDASAASTQLKTQVAFFENLRKLCGQRFEGKTVIPRDNVHPQAGEKLTISVETCREKEIHIPFRVGEDKSRTWIFGLTPKGLLLKHEFRDSEGTPDEITMYGGLAAPSGTPYMQSFPANSETVKLLHDGATVIWTIHIDPEKQEFTYHLERHKAPLYVAVFDLKPLPNPNP